MPRAGSIHRAPGQGLKGRGLLGLHADDALIIGLDPALLHGAFKVFDDVALLPVLVVRLPGEEQEAAVQVVFQALEGVAGAVHALRHRVLPAQQADSGAYAGGVSAGLPADALPGRRQLARQFLPAAPDAGHDDEVIVRPAHHQVVRELRLQRRGHLAKQPVPLAEAVLVVVGLHGRHVHIDDRRRLTVPADDVRPLPREFVQIVDVGQLGQRVGVESVLLKNRVALYKGEHDLPGLSHVDIPDHRKLRAIRHRLPLAEAVDQLVPVADAAAEGHVVGAPPVQKVVADPGNHAHVVRVHPLKQTRAQPFQHPLPRHSGVFHKALRGQHGNRFASDLLIVDKGQRAALIGLSQILREAVHSVTSALVQGAAGLAMEIPSIYIIPYVVGLWQHKYL